MYNQTRMKLKTIIILFSIGLSACQNNDLLDQNEKLRVENDSLVNVLNGVIQRPFITNTQFTTSKSDTFKTNFVSAVLNGIKIDSVEVLGVNKTRSNQMIRLTNDDYGTELAFMPDSVGNFQLKAYSRITSWGERVIPLTFPIWVSEE